jgi:Sulfotransferase family
MSVVSTSAPETRGALQASAVPALLPNSLPDPLFLLAPPRSFTSLIGTMVGRHPQLYGLAETHLFPFATLAEWWRYGAEMTWPMRDGLVRIVAELYFGGQTDATVQRAAAWLRRRLHLSTGAILEAFIERVAPRILVDKSPSIVWLVASMRRAYAMFPRARFIHLVRHPRGHGESVLKYHGSEGRKYYEAEARSWLVDLGSFPPEPPEPGQEAEPPVPAGTLDPQWGWFNLHRNIMNFLAGVPASQVYRLRGEDVLTDPDNTLRPLCAWLGLRDDPAAIDEMKHPERSPFACIGPPAAPTGNDFFFLKSPALRPSRAEPKSLDGPLPWRPDGRGFAPAVRRLALELGYT